MKENDDSYISYIDTDSLFIKLNQYLIDRDVDIDKWNNLSRDIKTKFLLKLSKCIEKSVNERAYRDIQRGDYNSHVEKEDFGIIFKQEIVCSNILHLGPKMYSFRMINCEGWHCDRIDAKGIEIVRSSSPKVFRSVLKDLLEHLLKGKDDKFLSDMIESHRSKFLKAIPEDVSVNTGVNKLSTYLDGFTYKKGTPYHVKGVANYHYLLDELKLGNKYETIKESDKCKVVYLKPNRYGFKVLTYYRWPKEFDKVGILVDYPLMVEKYFTSKAHILLDPINRENILNDNTVMDSFFLGGCSNEKGLFVFR